MLNIGNSVAFKIVVFAVGAITAVFLCVSTLLWHYGEAFLSNYSREQAEGMTRSIATSVAEAVSEEDIASLEQVLHNYAIQEAVLFAVVYDSRDKPLAYVVNDLGAWNSYNKDIYSSGKYMIQESMVIPDESLTVSTNDSVLYGRTVLGYSTKYYDMFSEYFLPVNIITWCVFIIVNGVVVFLFTQRLDKRVSELANASWRISHGDTSYVFSDRHDDAIGRVSGALDSMRKSLLRRETEIRRLKDNLKLQVKERTFEIQMEMDKAHISLQEANSYLSSVVRKVLPTVSSIISKSEDIIENRDEEELEYILKNVREIRRHAKNVHETTIFASNATSLGEEEVHDYEPKPFDAYNVLEEVLIESLPLVQNNHTVLWLNYASDSPRLVVGDEGRFHHVVRIILEEASKFSIGDAIEVRAWSSPVSDKQHLYSFEVYYNSNNTDNYSDAMFNSSWGAQPHKGHTGMSVCRSMVVGMNGKLHTGNCDNGGVYCSVELVMEGKNTTTEESATELTKKLKGKNIVLLSENDAFSQLLRGCFENHGMRAVATSTHHAALESLKLMQKAKEEVSCILVDCECKDITRFIAKVRSIEFYKNIGVITLSQGSEALHKVTQKYNVHDAGVAVGNLHLLKTISNIVSASTTNPAIE